MITSDTKSYIEKIQKASRENRLVIFAGAGVSNNSGVPAWSSLINGLKDDLTGLVGTNVDDLKLAQLYKDKFKDPVYHDKIKELLLDGKVATNPVHDAVMALSPTHIITTNYDDLFEQEFVKTYTQYSVVRQDEDLPSVKSSKLLIKMHGDFALDNIVLAESEYYDYSRNFPLIRAYVQSLIASKTVLFIGFSFDDINLKYIMRELQSILEKHMQNVYMLTDKQFTGLEATYLTNKGIVPICMTKDDAIELLKSQPYKVDVPSCLTNVHGQNLYRSLCIIKNYCNCDNLLDAMLEQVSKYDDKIAYWGGQYLRNLMPDCIKKNWNYKDRSLRLTAEELEVIHKSLASYGGKKTFIEKYGTSYRELQKYAWRNHIILYNGKNLCSKSSVKRVNKTNTFDGTDYFFSLDIENLDAYTTSIRSNGRTYTNKDLELPYLYYLEGKYSDALCLYTTLARELWSRQEYVLYFISMYNIKVLSGLLNMDLTLRKKHSVIDNLLNEAKNIDLNKVLDELNLEDSVRILFEDLLSNRFYFNLQTHATVVSNAIIEQRKNAVNGGSSWNSHASELTSDFWFLYTFCNNNFVICDKSYIAKNVWNSVASGILNSVLIDSDQQSNSHQEKLYADNLLLLLFYADYATIEKAFEGAELHSIDVDEAVKERISVIIKNLLSVSDPKKHALKEVVEFKIISNIVRNLVLLLNYIKLDGIECNGIYTIISGYMRIMDELTYAKLIPGLLSDIAPSPDEAFALLQVYANPISQYHNQPWYLRKLADKCAEGGKGLPVVNIEDLKNLNVVCKAAIMPALGEDIKKAATFFIRENTLCLADAIIIDHEFGVKILDKVLFNSLMHKQLSLDPTKLNMEEIVCRWVLDIEKEPAYEYLKLLIEEFRKDNKMFAFFSEPLSFCDKDFEVKWLASLPDDSLREMLKNDSVWKKTRHYFEEHPEEAFYKDAIMKCLI